MKHYSGRIYNLLNRKGGEIIVDDLRNRREQFLTELGVSVTQFCKRIQLSSSGFYAWRGGQLKLSDATLARIDGYLRKYNF